MMADYVGDFSISYDDAAGSCTIRFRCFDTPNSVSVYGCVAPDYQTEDLLLSIRRRCLWFHRCWSFSLSGSDVARINAARDRVEVDDCTAQLLQAMKRFHDAEPAFDFTIGPVSYLWKHATAVPGADEVHAALEHVGANKVRIEGNIVVKDDPFVQVDVGGAAKGFAADAIVAMLREAGVASADVDLGGNLFMMGSHPSGRPWRVSVRDPRGEGPSASACVLEVTDRAVVTSGSYERFVEVDGVRYQHIVDARTGWPSTSRVVSAPVVAESALSVGAWMAFPAPAMATSTPASKMPPPVAMPPVAARSMRSLVTNRMPAATMHKPTTRAG